jgi:RNA polymerase sigma-70 factor, ECF subfamily
VVSLQNGSVDAFEELYHRYRRHIFTFCLKLAGDRSLAEDATHDTFLRMHQNIERLNDISLFRTWLFTIARNGVFKQLNKDRRNGTLEDESAWTDETPHSLMESKDAAAVIAACINALKPEYREVLLLREYEQHSYDAIAAITGDTESSVKSRLFKARKALAERLRTFFSE